mmetsp:Transcript_27507/g.92404  ORF Transcript_27507/g.92404 Transcript_27507/m.92404 type:complete len:201 (+) Transcript_27507:885-1487(+)
MSSDFVGTPTRLATCLNSTFDKIVPVAIGSSSPQPSTLCATPCWKMKRDGSGWPICKMRSSGTQTTVRISETIVATIPASKPPYIKESHSLVKAARCKMALRKAVLSSARTAPSSRFPSSSSMYAKKSATLPCKGRGTPAAPNILAQQFNRLELVPAWWSRCSKYEVKQATMPASQQMAPTTMAAMQSTFSALDLIETAP